MHSGVGMRKQLRASVARPNAQQHSQVHSAHRESQQTPICSQKLSWGVRPPGEKERGPQAAVVLGLESLVDAHLAPAANPQVYGRPNLLRYAAGQRAQRHRWSAPLISASSSASKHCSSNSAIAAATDSHRGRSWGPLRQHRNRGEPPTSRARGLLGRA